MRTPTHQTLTQTQSHSLVPQPDKTRAAQLQPNSDPRARAPVSFNPYTLPHTVSHCTTSHILTLTPLLTHSLTPLLTHSLTHSLTYSTRTHSHWHILTCAHTHLTRTHSHWQILTRNLLTLPQTHTYSHTHTHTHTHTHAYTQPHTHTTFNNSYIHACIDLFIWLYEL